MKGKIELPELSGLTDIEKMKAMYDCLNSFRNRNSFHFFGYGINSPYKPFFDLNRQLVNEKKTILGDDELTFGHIGMLADMCISCKMEEGIQGLDNKFKKLFEDMK